MTVAINRAVLVLAEYGWRNGGENSWLAVSNLLVERGWRFIVACPCPSEFANHLPGHRIATIDWQCHDLDGERKSQAQIRAELATLIGHVQPTLVHCNSLATTRLAGPVTSELQVPAVGYLRDIIKLSRQAVDDINQISAIVAVSEATRTFHLAQEIRPDKIHVIYNGVDLQHFYPRTATGYLHDELQIPRTHRLILCIGQIGLRKGTDCVIKTFLKLAASFSDIHLLLVGMRNSKKDEAVKFENHCRHLGESSVAATRVHWLGRRTDVPQMLGESSLLLHGARQEPLGRVLLEAAASGCPIVTTDAGGTKEIITGVEFVISGKSGIQPPERGTRSPTADGEIEFLVCPVDSVADLTAAAGMLLNNESLRQRTGKQLRQIAESRFDATTCAEKLGALYCRLLD